MFNFGSIYSFESLSLSCRALGNVSHFDKYKLLLHWCHHITTIPISTRSHWFRLGFLLNSAPSLARYLSPSGASQWSRVPINLIHLCFTHSLKYVKTSLRAAKQTLPDPHTRNFSSANLTLSLVSKEEDCK